MITTQNERPETGFPFPTFRLADPNITKPIQALLNGAYVLVVVF